MLRDFDRGGYVGALAPLTPAEHARKVMADAQRREARRMKALRRADPMEVAALVCEHVAMRSSAYLPGEALTVEVGDLLQSIGVNRSMRAAQPGRHEAIAVAALVGLGFCRGTRGQAVVFRKLVAPLPVQQRRSPLSFNQAARKAAADGLRPRDDVQSRAAGSRLT